MNCWGDRHSPLFLHQHWGRGSRVQTSQLKRDISGRPLFCLLRRVAGRAGARAGFLLGSHGLPGTGSFSQQISFVPVGTHWLLLEPRSHTRTWMASSCHPFFLCPLPPQSLRPCPSRKGAHLSHLAFHTQIPHVLWLSCSLFACLFMERRGDRSIPAPPVKRKEINTWGGGGCAWLGFFP